MTRFPRSATVKDGSPPAALKRKKCKNMKTQTMDEQASRQPTRLLAPAFLR